MKPRQAHRFPRTAVLSFAMLAWVACAQGSGEQAEMTEEATYEGIEIVAHRGDSWNAPENTLVAVTSAWEKNTDAVEVDVYLTSDERVVALHDRTTERTGDADLNVNESTSEQLREVDVGSWKSEEFAGEPIPYLEDIVASIPAGDKRLFIEIKYTAETVPYIKEIVEESGKQDQIVIIGFELETVRESKQVMPEIPTYWLLSAPEDDDGNPEALPLDVVAIAQESNLDGLNVNYQGISQELVDECRRQGLGIYVWTVNETPDLELMAGLAVDGITTDRIDQAQAVLW